MVVRVIGEFASPPLPLSNPLSNLLNLLNLLPNLLSDPLSNQPSNPLSKPLLSRTMDVVAQPTAARPARDQLTVTAVRTLGKFLRLQESFH